MPFRPTTWLPWARLINAIYSSFPQTGDMEKASFITRPMSVLLDGVRGLAALAVLCGHAVQIGIYDGYYPLSRTVQHNAVIVFFVLSGLVIAHSVQRRHASLSDYTAARVARIVPVAAMAVGFSLVVSLYGEAAGFGYPWPGADLRNVLLPLVFLSESVIGASLVWNPPFWSLVYEVWYYALFGAAVFLRRRERWLWCALLALIAGWKVLLLMPVWLIGAALAQETRRLPLRSAPVAIAAGIGLGWLASGWAEPVSQAFSAYSGLHILALGFSQYVLTDMLLGIGVAVIFLGCAPVAERYAGALEKARGPLAWLAGCSFTLYVVHWPLLLVLRGHGLVAGDNALAFAAIMAGVVALCGVMAALVERRSPQIKAWLLGRVARRVLQPA
jgi:peptidoglycan/LPS O-acetylase OafA/YrhL